MKIYILKIINIKKYSMKKQKQNYNMKKDDIRNANMKNDNIKAGLTT